MPEGCRILSAANRTVEARAERLGVSPMPDVVPMISRGRRMQGWVRTGPSAFGDDALRRKLVDAALAFVRSLPAK